MEILFIPKGSAVDLMNEKLDNIQSEELGFIKNELSLIDGQYVLRETNIGTGADWVLIHAIMDSITFVFLLGDKIDKGLEGWVKIGKRIKRIFTKADKVYLDKDAATILAIAYLANEIKVRSLKKIVEAIIPIQDLSGMLKDRKSDDFIAKPYCVYIITFEVNDHIIKTIGIRSDGKITEHYSFDKNTSPLF